MEYFEPLRQVLDELTGKPDVVNAHAANWNMANELGAMATELESSPEDDLSDWHGDAADAHHRPDGQQRGGTRRPGRDLSGDGGGHRGRGRPGGTDPRDGPRCDRLGRGPGDRVSSRGDLRRDDSGDHCADHRRCREWARQISPTHVPGGHPEDTLPRDARAWRQRDIPRILDADRVRNDFDRAFSRSLTMPPGISTTDLNGASVSILVRTAAPLSGSILGRAGAVPHLPARIPKFSRIPATVGVLHARPRTMPIPTGSTLDGHATHDL